MTTIQFKLPPVQPELFELLCRRMERVESYIAVEVERRLTALDSGSEHTVTATDIEAWVDRGDQIRRAYEAVEPDLGRGQPISVEKTEQSTNFQAVALYNRLFGNIAGNPCEADYWNKLESQLDLIYSEFKELEEAIQGRNIKQLRDGICDVLVTTYGMGHRAGFDSDVDMEQVNLSNMSKFCTHPDELHASVEKYKQLGVEVDFHAVDQYFALVSAKNQTGTDGVYYPQGKNLKGVCYHTPKFL